MALSGSFTGAIRDGKYTLRVDWSATQSVANNTSTVTCKHYLIVAANYWVDFGGRDNTTSIDGTSLAWSSPAVDCDGGTVYLGEVSRTVSHSADGSKSLSIAATFNIQITAGGVFWSAINASAYVALDTIPRASSISMPATVTMGRAVTLTVNRASSAFTHRLRYHFGGQQAYFAQGVGASYSWTVPKDLAYEIPNAAVGVGRVYCETYNGSALIGTDSVGFTAAAPEDMIPSLAYTLAETGSALAGMFVQGRSRLKVQLTAVGAYGSAPRSYAIQANGATYAASSATTGALTQAGANTVTMRVTDSRGRTATRTATIDVKAYREPWIDRFTAVRCDQDGNPSDQGAAVLCTVSGGLTELPGNAGELAVYYRRSDQDEETRLPLPAPGPAFTATAQAPDIDPDHSYSFRVALRDAFTTTTRAQAVSTAAVTFDIRASGNGLAFGKVAEHEKAVEVAAGWELWLGDKPFVPYKATRIPDGADLNHEAYKIAGDYFCSTNQSAQTLQHCPTRSAFYLRVRVNSGIVQQQIEIYTGNAVILRGYFNWSDLWGDWCYYFPKETQITQLALPLSSAVETTLSGCRYSIDPNGWVSVVVALRLKPSEITSSTVVATLPVGYRPGDYIYTMCAQLNGGFSEGYRPCTLFCRSDGTIVVNPTNRTEQDFYGTLTFRANG
ncbi:MAG: DUF859 family phage minor structural protein [Christensenellales bacterium]|jgi:hypothetical protein